MTVAEEIHRMTVDEYIRIVRDFGWESTELVRYSDPEGASFRTVDRFDVGENAGGLDVATMLKP